MLNWNIWNPSSNNFLRKRVAALRSFRVSVGRSKNTSTHMLRYWLSREKRLVSITLITQGFHKILDTNGLYTLFTHQLHFHQLVGHPIFIEIPDTKFYGRCLQ